MNGVNDRIKRALLFTIALVMLLSGCKAHSSTTNATTSTTLATLPAALSQYQLEYRLFSEFPNVFWCDPDYYPVARTGQEQQNAIAQFSTIKSNQPEFSAILSYLNL